MTNTYQGANGPGGNSERGLSESGQRQTYMQQNTDCERKNKQWRAAQVPSVGHPQRPAAGACIGNSSYSSNWNNAYHTKEIARRTQGVVADRLSNANRGVRNNKQICQQRGVNSPKTGPSLTDKSWITRGLKPDHKLACRDEHHQSSFTREIPQGTRWGAQAQKNIFPDN